MGYCATTALGGYPYHLDKIHYIWMVTSLYICSTPSTNMPIITPILVTSSIHLLLPENICFHPSQATCELHHWLIHNTLIYHICVSNPPARHCSSYHFGDKLWKVVESETMEILSGDKVPLGDNKGATSGNCI